MKDMIYKSAGAILVIMILIFSIPVVNYSIEQEKTLEQIENNRENITFYLNGTEVSSENIDIMQYNFSYDEKENKVFLAEKRDTRFLPILMPH